MMKLFELQKCPKCRSVKCHCGDDGPCPACRHDPCVCNEENEEVQYNGRKVLVGKHSDETDSRFDRDELSMGIEDELEGAHGDARVAKNVAKDHLLQMPQYYSRKRRAANLRTWIGHDDNTI